jgi:hypothetical protein
MYLSYHDVQGIMSIFNLLLDYIWNWLVQGYMYTLQFLQSLYDQTVCRRHSFRFQSAILFTFSHYVYKIWTTHETKLTPVDFWGQRLRIVDDETINMIPGLFHLQSFMDHKYGLPKGRRRSFGLSLLGSNGQKSSVMDDEILESQWFLNSNVLSSYIICMGHPWAENHPYQFWEIKYSG